MNVIFFRNTLSHSVPGIGIELGFSGSSGIVGKLLGNFKRQTFQNYFSKLSKFWFGLGLANQTGLNFTQPGNEPSFEVRLGSGCIKKLYVSGSQFVLFIGSIILGLATQVLKVLS